MADAIISICRSEIASVEDASAPKQSTTREGVGCDGGIEGMDPLAEKHSESTAATALGAHRLAEVTSEGDATVGVGRQNLPDGALIGRGTGGEGTGVELTEGGGRRGTGTGAGGTLWPSPRRSILTQDTLQAATMGANVREGIRLEVGIGVSVRVGVDVDVGVYVRDGPRPTRSTAAACASHCEVHSSQRTLELLEASAPMEEGVVGVGPQPAVDVTEFP